MIWVPLKCPGGSGWLVGSGGPEVLGSGGPGGPVSSVGSGEPGGLEGTMGPGEWRAPGCSKRPGVPGTNTNKLLFLSQKQPYFENMSTFQHVFFL